MVGAVRECEGLGYDTEHMEFDVVMSAKQDVTIANTDTYDTI